MSSLAFERSSPVQRFSRWVRSVLFYEHWTIGFINQPIEKSLKWQSVPPVHWIEGFNKKRYLADPFPWPGSADTILCESYDVSQRIGRLVALKLNEEGIADEMDIDLPIDGHLSFPFMFKHEGRVFLMPEASEAKRLEIFCWQPEDGKWISHAVVIDQKAVADAVLFEKDGYFWIAFTDVTDDPHDNLNLIYAPALTGPWLSHPANPVQRGRGFCRGAGALFTHEGKLYRPAQDCSEVYGGAIRIMEIVDCTPTHYDEREVTHILPSDPDFPDGFHTLLPLGNRCLTDGMKLTFSGGLLLRKLLNRLKF